MLSKKRLGDVKHWKLSKINSLSLDFERSTWVLKICKPPLEFGLIRNRMLIVLSFWVRLLQDRNPAIPAL